MVRERIQEVVDFATTESPYRSATKGWISDDVYLQLGSSSEKSRKQGEELANVSVYWKPITQIGSLLFAVLSVATVFVFLAVSLSHGRLNIPKASFEVMPEVIPVEIQADSADIEEAVTFSVKKEAPTTSVQAASEDLIPSATSENSVSLSLGSQSNSEDPVIRKPMSRPMASKSLRRATTAMDLFQSKHL